MQTSGGLIAGRAGRSCELSRRRNRPSDAPNGKAASLRNPTLRHSARRISRFVQTPLWLGAWSARVSARPHVEGVAGAEAAGFALVLVREGSDVNAA